MTDAPPCRDCRWFRSPYCFHASAAKTSYRPDLVSGNPRDREYHRAEIQRGEWLQSDCGPRGKHFEPLYIDLTPDRVVGQSLVLAEPAPAPRVPLLLRLFGIRR
jgi:hypothetical protein